MKIFIVEDDIWYSEILEYHISLNPDYEVTLFKQGKEVLKRLNEKPDVITLDYSLPDISCERLMASIREVMPEVPIIIVSGQEDVGTAVKLLKKGIFDYIVKDEDTKDRLWITLQNVKKNVLLRQELDQLREEVQGKYDFSNILKGSSAAMQRVFMMMEKAAKTQITVSISGETGTGKELVAKAIHYNSPRKNKPLVAVNVSAIPNELIESELFGHEKGAFTGANARRVGKFEEAQKGTIFLDEIGEMDLNMQAKLLRVLQEKEVTRIGGSKTVKLDVRVIVATHRNLAEQVQKGKFREDLYYRLLGLPIELPPLRDRDNDVLLLAKHFLKQAAKENGLGKLNFSSDAQEKLKRYPYPGNVRELKAVVELAAVMCDGEKVTDEDISFRASSSEADFLVQEMTLKEYNNKIIKHFLKKYDHNVLKVAEKLDIGKSTIYRMLQEEKED